MKRSGWIRFVTTMQLFFALSLIAFSLDVLVLAYRWVIHFEVHDAATGLIIASAVLGGPGLIALVGWWALQRERRWGWFVALFGDLVMLGILIHSMIDDGWHNIDWDTALMAVLSLFYSVVPFLARGGRVLRDETGIGPHQRHPYRATNTSER